MSVYTRFHTQRKEPEKKRRDKKQSLMHFTTMKIFWLTISRIWLGYSHWRIWTKCLLTSLSLYHLIEYLNLYYYSYPDVINFRCYNYMSMLIVHVLYMYLLNIRCLFLLFSNLFLGRFILKSLNLGNMRKKWHLKI